MGWNYGGRKSELKFTEDRVVHDIIIFFKLGTGRRSITEYIRYRIYRSITEAPFLFCERVGQHLERSSFPH